MDDDDVWGGDDLVLAYLETLGSTSTTSSHLSHHSPRAATNVRPKRARQRSALTPTSSAELILNARPKEGLISQSQTGHRVTEKSVNRSSVGDGVSSVGMAKADEHNHGEGPSRKRIKSEEGSFVTKNSGSTHPVSSIDKSPSFRWNVSPCSSLKKTESALSLLRKERLEAKLKADEANSNTINLVGSPSSVSISTSVKVEETFVKATPPVTSNKTTRSLRPRPSQIIDISESPPTTSKHEVLPIPSSHLPSNTTISSNDNKPSLPSSSTTSSSLIKPNTTTHPPWLPTTLTVPEVMAAYNARTKAELERRKAVEKEQGRKREKEVKNEDGTDKRSGEEITKHLLKTLTDASNPITHSDLYSRTQHVISCATGHQVTNRASGAKFGISGSGYLKSRNAKLRSQLKACREEADEVGEEVGVDKDAEGDGQSISYPTENPKTGSQWGAVTDKVGVPGIGIGGRFSMEMAKKKEEREGSVASVSSNRGGVSESGSAGEQRVLGATSDIFANLTFYLNGYSGPRISDLELKRLLVMHGGNVTYVATSACTHILVVNNLSASKAQKFLERSGAGSRGRRKTKVVHVNWVLDSVEQGKRLSEIKYNIISKATQPTLMSSWSGGGKAGNSAEGGKGKGTNGLSTVKGDSEDGEMSL